MAIQIPDAGTGNGATGDNEFVLWTKVINNFSDQTNAASRLVGTGAEQIPQNKNLGTAATKNVGTVTGQIPLAQDTFKAAFGGDFVTNNLNTPEMDCDNIPLGVISLIDNTTSVNAPPSSFSSTGSSSQMWTIYSVGASSSPTVKTGVQLAFSYARGVGAAYRTRHDGIGGFKSWTSFTTNPATYTTTTASGANVAVDSNGVLMRSTSSERYKDILAPLELDDARYADAMALKPIVYRSTADADNPAYHYYSFSAEELGAYDPAFTLWRETETVTDEDGNVTERPLAERQVEGININALLAMSHAIAIKQGDLIKDLQKQINALKPKSEV